MKILIACEESQRVCMAFREMGHEAYSADILECSGGHPEWHIKGDCIPLINGRTEFITQDGKKHRIEGRWDMLIAHPPCTFLTNTGNRWFNVEKYGESALKRLEEREKAAKFFMIFVNADCDRIAIENPIGYMSSYYKKPTQIVQPYMFGDNARKATCLWLKNIEELQPENIVEPDIYYYVAKNGRIKSDSKWRGQYKKEERAIQRSKTFPGMAKAMSHQWGKEK